MEISGNSAYIDCEIDVRISKFPLSLTKKFIDLWAFYGTVPWEYSPISPAFCKRYNSHLYKKLNDIGRWKISLLRDGAHGLFFGRSL